jgi:hypothetical protein
VCAKLAFAGTFFIQAIPAPGQPSFAIARYSSPTATRFMTCGAASIKHRELFECCPLQEAIFDQQKDL